MTGHLGHPGRDKRPVLVVHSLKVIQGPRGLFVAMPARKALSGAISDIVHPTNQALRARLERAVLIRWFWPANAALWAVAQGRAGAMQDPEAIAALVRQWVAFDRVRIGAGLLAFVLCIRAIGVPYPGPGGRQVA